MSALMLRQSYGVMSIIQMYLPVALFVKYLSYLLQLLHYLKTTSRTEVMRGSELRVLVGQ